MKTLRKTFLATLCTAVLTLSAACTDTGGNTFPIGDQNDPTDPNDPGDPGDDPNQPGDPTDPGNCEACFVQFEDCLSQSGLDPNLDPSGTNDAAEQCQAALEECISQCEPPPPPPIGECNECFESYQNCVEDNYGPNGQQDPDIGICEDLLNECLQGCEPPPPPPPPDICEGCFDQYEACLQTLDPSGQDNGEECEWLLDQCLADCAEPPPPPFPTDPCDVCFIEHQECVGQCDQNGFPVDECDAALEECLQSCQLPPPPPPEPDDCFAEFEQCLNDNANDPQFCEWILEDCVHECP